MKPVALITGASRGIGRAGAVELAKRGYAIAAVARTQPLLHELRDQIGALPVVADVSDPDQAAGAIEQASRRLGRLDAIVHCAGVAPVSSVEQTTPQEWRHVLDTNLSAAFYLARAAWPIFRAQAGGVIVNISSLAARDPFPGFAAYAAAKAGLHLLDLVLAREGGEIGVRVHTLALGAVETEMFRRIVTPQQYPIEHTLTPEEVGQTITACVTGELRHTSGEVIYLHKKI